MTLERVKELLNYNSETGIFNWRFARSGANQASKVGTITPRGYVLICIDREHVFAHRLALFYINGKWPESTVDHIDGNPLNNSFSNLRIVSQGVNLQNQRRVKKGSKSGVMGVSYCVRDDIWRARIQVDGVRKTFYSKDRKIAEQMYLDAKRKLHIGCTI